MKKSNIIVWSLAAILVLLLICINFVWFFVNLLVGNDVVLKTPVEVKFNQPIKVEKKKEAVKVIIKEVIVTPTQVPDQNKLY